MAPEPAIKASNAPKAAFNACVLLSRFMNVIDSSLWLEYFADTETGNAVSEIIENTDELSLFAVKIGKDFKLPMADSIIYAT